MKKLELRQIIREEILETLLQQEGSTAAKEAERLGLDYMSFGRWGKNGQVTHKSEKGKLIPVSRDQVQKTTGMSFEKPTSNILQAKRKDGTSRPAANYDPQTGKVSSWNMNSPEDQKRNLKTKNSFADPLSAKARGKEVDADAEKKYPPSGIDPKKNLRDKFTNYEYIAKPYQSKIEDALYNGQLAPYKAYSPDEFSQISGVPPQAIKFISLLDKVASKLYRDYTPLFYVDPRDGNIVISDLATRDD